MLIEKTGFLTSLLPFFDNGASRLSLVFALLPKFDDGEVDGHKLHGHHAWCKPERSYEYREQDIPGKDSP